MRNPRISAALIVKRIIEEKIFFGELKNQVPEKDLPFTNMLVLTVLRKLAGLNALLSSYLTRKIPHKHRMAQYLLLSACAELLFMDTKPYAVINETVRNIRQTTDSFLAGLANAILRRIAQHTENARQIVANTCPFPSDFVKLLHGYSEEEKANITAGIENIPPLDITVKENPRFWAEKLNAELLPNGSLRLLNAVKISELPGYATGSWWVQDAAASLAVQSLGDIRGLNIVDLCAAPGGKTAQLAAGGANVTAIDISAARLETLKRNMNRLGLDNITIITADALDYLQNSEEKFDIILLDAPCSATGTFRRHPEILHIKNQEDVAAQCILQCKLLNDCKNILKKGGTLLYSVCSICQDEGEKQIKNFLNTHNEFKLVPITSSSIEKYGHWQTGIFKDSGIIRTLPSPDRQKNDMDSFFICKMKRII